VNHSYLTSPVIIFDNGLWVNLVNEIMFKWSTFNFQRMDISTALL
jgi:hypothetical protein